MPQDHNYLGKELRIVQSFWSAGKDLMKHSYAWPSAQYHIMSWALSCLTFKRFYNNIHLYTDKEGCDILVDYLQLPYTSIKSCYNNLESPSKLFALPKILTYKQQEKPFLHADGDVYLWEKFDPELESANLIAQNLELGTIYSRRMIGNLAERLISSPSVIIKNMSSKTILSYNAGILGGSDIDFFKEYTKIALDWINQNQKIIESKKVHGNFNILFEQILFYSLSNHQNKSVTCYIKNPVYDNSYSQKEFTDFSATPYRLKYLHLIGGHKTVKQNYTLMSKTLFEYFPQYYFKIIKLFSKEHVFFNSKIKDLEATQKETISKKTISSEKIAPHYKNTSWRKKVLFIFDPISYQKFIKKEYKRIKAISSNTLYKWEKAVCNSFAFFYQSQKKQSSACIIPNPFINVIETTKASDSSFLRSKENHTLNNTTTIAIVPELFFKGYNEVILDDLCFNIIILLKVRMTFKQLLKKIELCFDKNDITENYTAFYELVLLKLKFLYINKCILIYDVKARSQILINKPNANSKDHTSDLERRNAALPL